MIATSADKNIKEPRITLVGAGPGDTELITLKGVKALQTADVVLYDALVNEEMLDFAPAHAVKVYVGKRSGDHSFSQDAINKLMIDYALNYGHVVRLKGGDPFIFGRGYEEVLFAREHGIKTYFIPGITSMQASGFMAVFLITGYIFLDIDPWLLVSLALILGGAAGAAIPLAILVRPGR